MFTWRKWWLLFAVIWVAVAVIQIWAILVFSEEPERAWQPAILAVVVPAAGYFLGWVWEKLRKKT